MAATSQPLATQAAVAILRVGGSAVDAALAANAVLTVTEPTGCGLGGDLFALVWDAGPARLHGLNGSGRSPQSLAAQHFANSGHGRIPSTGPLPITVPGCVDGWLTLHAKFGHLPMEKVLEPAIEYATGGFPVSPDIARQWAAGATQLRDQPGFAEVFLPHGQPPRRGEVFRNPAAATTLRHIARAGRDAFYLGDLAKELVTFVQQCGGFLSQRDLAEHRSEWVEPISTVYRDHEVWQLPPNAQGLAVLQMLNILEGFDLRAMGFGSADYLHVLIEAKKLAFEDRARWYADPTFAPAPIAQLLDPGYAATQRRRIDRRHAATSVDALRLEAGDTVYLTTADEAGNMVSLIQSNYRGLGSGVVPPALGFGLQNRGELFDLAPGKPNSYAPGKRPFHTIIPGFVTRAGQAHLSFGVMGGAMQPQGQVQILVNLIDFGMDLQQAGDAPRVRHLGSSEPTGERMTDGGEVWLEQGLDDATAQSLQQRGHRVTAGVCPAEGGFGGYQAVLRQPVSGVYHGASESRKDGQAAGY